jgi:hypothetical protein
MKYLRAKSEKKARELLPKGFELSKRTLRRFGKGKRHFYWIAKPEKAIVEEIKEKVKEEAIKKIKPFNRYSIAINFPIHKKYYGCLGQIWTFNPDIEHSNFIKKKTRDFLLDYLKYDIKDLWFELVMEGEGWQEVPYKKELEERYELYIEDEHGATIKSDSGKYG